MFCPLFSTISALSQSEWHKTRGAWKVNFDELVSMVGPFNFRLRPGLGKRWPVCNKTAKHRSQQRHLHRGWGECWVEEEVDWFSIEGAGHYGRAASAGYIEVAAACASNSPNLFPSKLMTSCPMTQSWQKIMKKLPLHNLSRFIHKNSIYHPWSLDRSKNGRNRFPQSITHHSTNIVNDNGIRISGRRSQHCV